jgi:hypothetical protein
MTEAEWLAGDDLGSMLHHAVRWASARKLRLFACGCCRRIWPLINDRGRYAVETSERYADGQARPKELKAAYAAATRMSAGYAAHPGLKKSRLFATGLWAARQSGDVNQEYQAQVDLLRDIIGNPFRTVEVNPAWLAWNDGTVRNMAEAIYEERTFDQMPILADALEDAGCDNAEILHHCRQPGVHVRGCWVSDLLLGKG